VVEGLGFSADTKLMLKHALIPAILVAVLATLPALDSGPDIRLTHSERIAAKQVDAPLKVSALESGLPQTWCGTKSSTDQTVNASSNDNPKFKFYYVRAANMPDRFTEAAHFLQKSISSVHSYMLGVSNNTRTISIDLGTSCGSMYVDITALTLPGNLSSYQDFSGEVNPSLAINTLQLYADSIPGPPRHHIFMLDQFEPTNYIRGAGLQAIDDTHGAGNANNSNGLVAFVATPQGAIDQAVNADFPRALLHEMSHTMGAVQASAPNSTSAGHCTDGRDVMCYDDGSPEGAFYSDSVCNPGAIAGISRSFDCNNNDYFNPSPATGSYLDQKWNVFDSKYLVHCTDADPYCTSVPESTPLPNNPAARSAANNLYLYKGKKRGKKLGTVTATGAKEQGTSFVRNSVAMSSVRVPKGKWKISICFRESGESPVCESKKRSTSKSGRLSMPRIYVTTGLGTATARGSVSIKPVSASLKRRKYQVKTTTRPVSYSLDF
jgi:hypothetical protein